MKTPNTLKLSPFLTRIIWFIVLTLFAVVVFSIDTHMGRTTPLRALLFTGRIVSIIFLFFWTLVISEDLKEMVVLKYKIVDEDGWYLHVKYLTVFWLCICYWRDVEHDFTEYEAGNLFGATWTSHYQTGRHYKEREEAESAINRHREKVKKKRKRFFTPEKKDTKKITYVDFNEPRN